MFSPRTPSVFYSYFLIFLFHFYFPNIIKNNSHTSYKIALICLKIAQIKRWRVKCLKTNSNYLLVQVWFINIINKIWKIMIVMNTPQLKMFQVFVSYFFKNAIKSETTNCCCIQQLGRDKKQNNNIICILYNNTF